jgi:hypothetical protein
MANLIVSALAEWNGKAFTKAEKQINGLEKSVKNLGRAFGVGLSTAAIISFGKASVKAAAADQKAQQQLALALKNVGLGRDAASSEAYIQRLQSEFGIVDDLLRPAYQTLAVAVRDSNQAQKLLNLSLDISASTGRDLGSVTAALSKAYLGNTTSLSKLGVGISKADLKTKSFDDIVTQLTATFAGSATTAANTFQGSIDKLGVASANVKEIIGTGLIDALTTLGKDTSVADLAKNMESTALYLADIIRGIGVLGDKLKSIPILGSLFGNLQVGMIPIVGSYIEALREAGKQAPIQKAADNQHLQSLQAQAKLSTKIVNNAKKLTAAELATLKAKKLQAAIDKANLAINLGEGIFDLDKIQVAAALTNQAEQLGRVTSSAQVLQIANDTARLRVKQSISELEDAIAAKDEAAITRATAKLNKDLQILGALSGQNVKLTDIKSVLDSLQPKDLINLSNLEEALRLLGLINLASTGSKSVPATIGKPAPSVTGLTPATTIAETNANVASLGGVITQIQPNLKEFTPDSGMISGISPNGREYNFSVTVNTGIGDPNAIAEAVNQVIQDAVDRGTLRGGAY